MHSLCPSLSAALPRVALFAALFLITSALTLEARAQSEGGTIIVAKESFAGDVPSGVKASLKSTLTEALKADSRSFKVITAKETKNQLVDKNPSLAGCLTESCLKRAGKALDANLAVSTEVFGEAQIYDYKISFYDLSTGKVAQKKEVTCEICTGTEASELFRRTLVSTLSAVKIAKPKPPEPPKEVAPAKVELKITVEPAEASIELGDLPLGTGEVSTQVKPGIYTVRAYAEGYETKTTDITISPDTKKPRAVYVHLAPVEQKVAAPVLPPPVAAPAPAANSPLPIVGWSLVALGAVSTATGGYLLSIDGDTTCASGEVYQCPRVFNTTLEGSLLLGGGSAMLTSGIFLLILDADRNDRKQSKPATSFQLSVDPVQGGGFAGIRSTF